MLHTPVLAGDGGGAEAEGGEQQSIPRTHQLNQPAKTAEAKVKMKTTTLGTRLMNGLLGGPTGTVPRLFFRYTDSTSSLKDSTAGRGLVVVRLILVTKGWRTSSFLTQVGISSPVDPSSNSPPSRRRSRIFSLESHSKCKPFMSSSSWVDSLGRPALLFRLAIVPTL